MTDEEIDRMADNFVNAQYFTGVYSIARKAECGAFWKNGFLAGLKAGKDMNVATKWHDLRKNPKDLPLKGEKDYITNIGVMTFTSLHDRLIWTTPLCEACDYHVEVTDEVIAWCEIPVFEGV